MPRIALIHATPVAIDPVNEAFARAWPAATLVNLLDDSLSADLARTGRLDQAMTERFLTLARYEVACGADGILFTCSAFGTCIEAVQRELAPLPVLKPNQAMFEEAVATGGRIGMLVTFEPSVASMEREFHEMAAQGSDTAIQTVLVEDALEALQADDADRHDALIAEAGAELRDCAAVMLAQFSSARAKAAVERAVNCPVLTSPDSAVAKMRSSLAPAA